MRGFVYGQLFGLLLPSVSSITFVGPENYRRPKRVMRESVCSLRELNSAPREGPVGVF